MCTSYAKSVFSATGPVDSRPRVLLREPLGSLSWTEGAAGEPTLRVSNDDRSSTAAGDNLRQCSNDAGVILLYV